MRVATRILALLLLAGCMGGPAPPPGTGQGFEDSFDATHTLEGWENRAGRWELMDEPTAPSEPHVLEQQRMDLTVPGQMIATEHGTFGDVEISMSVRLLPGTSTGAGLVFRYVDASTYYAVWADSTHLRVEEYREGNATQLASAARSPTADSWTTLRVRATGGEFTVSLGEETNLVAHDPTLAVGHVGLWTAPGARAQFDDVAVKQL